jgi:hypothetical protein
MSPLFRDYGVEVIKQSPLLRGNVTKYGSEKSNSLSNPLRKKWFSGASASSSSVVYKRRNEVEQLLHQNYSFPNGRQLIKDDCSVLNGDNDAVKTISSPSIRTRQPPQTKLESLGSTSTWRILLLPAITLAFALFLHPPCIDTVELKFGSCQEPSECAIYTDFSDELGTYISQRVVLKRSLDTAKFIYASMYMDDSGNVTESESADRRLGAYNSSTDYCEIKTRLFTVDAVEYKKYIISEGSTSSQNDLFSEIVDNTTLLSGNTRNYLFSRDHAEPLTLLDITSLSQTGYLKGNFRYPVIDISLSHLQPPSSSAASSLSLSSLRSMGGSQSSSQSFEEAGIALTNMRLLISTQGRPYTIWSCVLILILSIISVVMLTIFLLGVILHIKFILGIEKKSLEILVMTKSNKNEGILEMGDDDENLVSTTDCILRRHHSLVLNEEKDVIAITASNSRSHLPVPSLFHWMELLLPEQFVTFSLLTALILWLNPFSAMLTLLSLMTQMNWFKGDLSVPDMVLFIFKLTEALGRQGEEIFLLDIFFSVYIS